VSVSWTAQPEPCEHMPTRLCLGICHAAGYCFRFPWVPVGDAVTFAARCEAIRELEGWPRLAESHELAKRINRGDFDGTR
jgi:hypothetical protein